jgi:antidote-toxin recognition MazE-like antitoxin
MPAKPKQVRGKKTPAKPARERMRARRQRLKTQRLRPVQHWVPDLRDPRVRADLRRQGDLLAQHPENAAIDAWIDAVHDWSEWK